MKRQHIFRGLMAVMLLLSAGQSLMAQEAFYIYRNDGDFNGFFYDEVKRMNLSKTDFDGVEHDDYVIQEVETEDSLYRIPLVAIDSIGFQQPEIRFSPRFRNLDKMGITPNVTVDDRWVLIFTFPKGSHHYVPAVDDVVAGFDEEVYGAGGLSGKIYEVEDQSDGYYDIYQVLLNPLDSFSDVFEQFISTELVYVDDKGKTRRRIAGCDEDGMPSATRGSGETGLLNLISFSKNISREWEPKSGVKINLGADLGLTVGLKATYNMGWRRVYIKLEQPSDFKLTPKVGISSSKDFEVEVDGVPKFLKSIPFPAACPIFQTLPVPSLVIRGGGELSATLTFPSMGFGVKQVYVIDTAAPLPLQYYMTRNASNQEATPDVINTAEADITLKGFLQTALKLSANIETCSWFEDLLFCRLGVDFFIGPKVEGQIKLSTDFIRSASSTILKDMSLTVTPLSADMEVNATLGYLFKDKENHRLFDANISLGTAEFRAVPKLTKIECSTTDWQNSVSGGTVTANLTTEGFCFLPSHVGAQIYNTSLNSGYNLQFDTSPHFFYDDKKVSTITFDNLSVGTYPILPYLKTLGLEYEADFPEDTPTPIAYVLPATFTHASGGASGLMVGKWRDEDYRNSNYGTSLYNVPIQCTGGNGEYSITGNHSTSWNRKSDYYADDGTTYSGTRSTQLSLSVKMIDGKPHVVSGSIKEIENDKVIVNNLTSRFTTSHHYEKIIELGDCTLPIRSIYARPTDEKLSELWDKDWEFSGYPNVGAPTYGVISFGGTSPNVIVTDNYTSETSGSQEKYGEWVPYTGHDSYSYHNDGEMYVGFSLGY